MARILAFAVTLALFWEPSSFGQICDIDDEISVCWAEVEKSVDPEALDAAAQRTAGAAAEQTEEGLVKSETGLDTAGSSLATTVRDFLNPVNLAALLGSGSSTDETEGSLVLDLNFILPGKIRERNGQLKLILNTEAELYEPLETALEESSDEDSESTVEDLKDTIGDLGESTVSFTLNWRGSKLGRYFGPHRELFRDLAFAVEPEPVVGSLIEFLSSFDTTSCTKPDPETCTFEELADGDQEKAVALRDQLEQSALDEAQYVSTFEARLAQVKLDRFDELLANQPQLSFSVGYTIRDDVVGPNEWSGKVTYELPLAPSLNRLEKELKQVSADCLGKQGPEYLVCQYSSYVEDNASDLDSSDRLSMSLEYVERDSLDAPLPGGGEPFTLDGSHELVFNLGWGRVLEKNAEGTARTRVDLVGSFEDVSDDPTRTDRGLLTLTVTRDFGGFAIPFGVVYSNKPEFLSAQDLDEEISAHIGLKYSIEGLGGDGGQ